MCIRDRGHAVRAVCGAPRITFVTELAALAEERLHPGWTEQCVPHGLDGMGHRAADDQRGVLGLRLDELRHDSTPIREPGPPLVREIPVGLPDMTHTSRGLGQPRGQGRITRPWRCCLLYTSDAADDLLC